MFSDTVMMMNSEGDLLFRNEEEVVMCRDVLTVIPSTPTLCAGRPQGVCG